MAQHDYNLANQNGAAFRADLNAALEAIQSVNSGATEPASTVAYMPWADTNSGLWKVRNAADSAWVSVMALTASRVDTADGTSYDNSGSGLAATTVKDALDELDASVSNVEGDYYSTGNIVGTVSESGGVPTGAILERGSNANGSYAKYADGTLICWIDSRTLTFASTSALSSTWTFPHEFSSVAATVASNIAGSYSGAPNLNDVISSIGSSGPSGASLQLRRISSAAAFTAGNTAVFTSIAIGRWF